MSLALTAKRLCVEYTPPSLGQLPDPILTDLFSRIEIYQIELFRRCCFRFKGLTEQNYIWVEVARQVGLDLTHFHPSFEQQLPSNILRLRAIRFIVRWCMRDSVRVERKPLRVQSARIHYLNGQVTAKDVCIIKEWWWKRRKSFAAHGSNFQIKVPGYTIDDQLFHSRDYFVLQRVLARRIQKTPRNFGELITADQIDRRREEVVSWIEKYRSRIQRLSILNLRFERLFRLPRILDVAHRLTHLYLSGNYLRSVPPAIERLTELVELSLDSNLITECAVDFTHLTRLERLNLSKNLLFQVPESTCGLPCLQAYDLSRNIISTIPEALSASTSLAYLNLGHNILTSIPNGVGTHSRFEFLDISYNRLTVKPPIADSDLLPTVIMEGNPFNTSYWPQRTGRFQFQVSKQ